MQERFLAGEVKESFDYAQVDDNTDFDDLDVLEVDEQERYLEADD
jgi:hypothetical protein